MIKSNKITKPNANAVGAGPVSARNSRGITLVALIITIIVMLILVGVSITIAINGGLFDTTKRAAKGTEKAKKAEQDLASGRIKIDEIWYDSLEDYAIGKQSAVQGVVDLNESNTKFIYTPAGWTNEEVKVKIEVAAETSGFTLQYSTDGINWSDYTTGTEISMSGGEIYAKLVDSQGNEGETLSGNIANIDKEAPIVNTEVNSAKATGTRIPLSINVTDSISGISKIEWHYKLDTASEYETKTDTYVEMKGKEAGDKGVAIKKETTLTGLEERATYNIYAEIYDVAGNVTRSPKTGKIDVTIKEIAIDISFEPNGNTEWQKTHSAKVTANADDGTASAFKYKWFLSSYMPTVQDFDDASIGQTGDMIQSEEGVTGEFVLGILPIDKRTEEAIVLSEPFYLYNMPPSFSVITDGIDESSICLTLTDITDDRNWKDRKCLIQNRFA